MDITNVIIKRRSVPGILLYGTNHDLLYANRVALELLPELRRKTATVTSEASQKIRQLCSSVLKCGTGKVYENGSRISPVLTSETRPPYYMRAFLLAGKDANRGRKQILILVEKVILKREINFADVKAEFKLTNREVEVSALLCDGLSNKGIAEKLSIGEYTVKDHIKKLMQKIGVSSRTGILNRLRS